jgi:hypothetical protein
MYIYTYDGPLCTMYIYIHRWELTRYYGLIPNNTRNPAHIYINKHICMYIYIHIYIYIDKRDTYTYTYIYINHDKLCHMVPQYLFCHTQKK